MPGSFYNTTGVVTGRPTRYTVPSNVNPLGEKYRLNALTDIVKKFTKAGADSSDQIQAVNDALREKANINQRDNTGRTVLMHAAKKGNKGTVQYLLGLVAEMIGQTVRLYTDEQTYIYFLSAKNNNGLSIYEIADLKHQSFSFLHAISRSSSIDGLDVPRHDHDCTQRCPRQKKRSVEEPPPQTSSQRILVELGMKIHSVRCPASRGLACTCGATQTNVANGLLRPASTRSLSMTDLRAAIVSANEKKSSIPTSRDTLFKRSDYEASQAKKLRPVKTHKKGLISLRSDTQRWYSNSSDSDTAPLVNVLDPWSTTSEK